MIRNNQDAIRFVEKSILNFSSTTNSKTNHPMIMPMRRNQIFQAPEISLPLQSSQACQGVQLEWQKSLYRCRCLWWSHKPQTTMNSLWQSILNFSSQREIKGGVGFQWFDHGSVCRSFYVTSLCCLFEIFSKWSCGMLHHVWNISVSNALSHTYKCLFVLIIDAVCPCQLIIFVITTHALFAVTQSSLCCKTQIESEFIFMGLLSNKGAIG